MSKNGHSHVQMKSFTCKIWGGGKKKEEDMKERGEGKKGKRWISSFFENI